MSLVQEEKKETELEKKSLLGVFKQKIPFEDINDPFDRQRCIQGWNQNVVENQTCLVLGIGGIGCSVAMALMRVGVEKIILVDYDKVEATNLNRQILYNLDSVGKLKSDAAKENLEKYHKISKNTPLRHIILMQLKIGVKFVNLLKIVMLYLIILIMAEDLILLLYHYVCY